MKKFIVILLTLVMAFSFSSCEKEGVYNPKKKIHRIFREIKGGSRQLMETWTWDGNKISKIDFPYNNWRFEYDGDLISRVISDVQVVTFNYTNKKLTKVDMKYGNELFASYAFTYSDKKVSKIVFTIYDFFIYKSSTSYASPLRFVLPEEVINICNEKSFEQRQNLKSTAEDEFLTTTVYFTWDGNNIKKMTQEVIDEGDVFNAYFEYTYDKMTNPFYGFNLEHDQYANSTSQFGLSKNNITKLIATESDDVSWYYECTKDYKYDGKFPIEVFEQYNDGDYCTIYYEYID